NGRSRTWSETGTRSGRYATCRAGARASPCSRWCWMTRSPANVLPSARGCWAAPRSRSGTFPYRRRFSAGEKGARVMGAEAILIWIIIGALAGWLAGLVVRGFGFGLLGNIIVGIIGAILGGWLLGALGMSFGGG